MNKSGESDLLNILPLLVLLEHEHVLLRPWCNGELPMWVHEHGVQRHQEGLVSWRVGLVGGRGWVGLRPCTSTTLASTLLLLYCDAVDDWSWKSLCSRI